MLPLVTLFSFFTLATATPRARSATGNCEGTISSLDDVDAAIQCTTVNVQSFTVPAGETFSLDLLQGTTVNVCDIEFECENWNGPLFVVKGENITLNGNDHKWNGNGPCYWDGLGGTTGGSTKPSPMMQIEMSGNLNGVYVWNSPERCFSVINIGPLVISNVVVDDSEGHSSNANSNGLAAGRNTDGFDVSSNDLTIRDCKVINQDDCLAINRGQNILFENNLCHDGHGISIGSISSDTVVENVVIQGNTVTNSMQGFRIKTKKSATNSRVNNVTYSGNSATDCTMFGVLIDTSYPETLGEPGNGVIISNVKFGPDPTKITVSGEAEMCAINCGPSSCPDTLDLSGLEISGGKVGKMLNVDVISSNHSYY